MDIYTIVLRGMQPVHTHWCKGLAAYLLRSPNPLPVDVKSAVCELAQNRAQIFGVPEGTLYAHEISFAKSCTIKPLEVTKEAKNGECLIFSCTYQTLATSKDLTVQHFTKLIS